MKLFLRFCIILFILKSYSQSTDCNNADPFCAGNTSLVFPNITGDNGFGSVGCLGSTPNPSWFYIQIDTPGDLNFEIIQSTGGFNENGDPLGTLLDVDFAIWGPYDNLNVCQGNSPPLSDIIDCSYLPDAIEFASISDAEEGDFYIVLITNYDGASGSILLNQISGNGSTDCSIVDRIEACEGDVVELDATTENAQNYIWEFDDGITTTILENGDIPIIEVEEGGTYIVTPQDSLGNDLTELIFNINFLPYINLIQPNPLQACETVPETGIAEFDLSDINSEIINSPENVTFSYYLTEEGAINSDPSSQINPLYTNIEPFNQTVYVKAGSLSTCESIIELDLVVNSLPNLENTTQTIPYCQADFPDTISIQALGPDIDPLLYEYIWSTGETEPSIEINEPGDYSVDISFTGENCFVTKTIRVEESLPTFENEDINLCDVTEFILQNNDYPEASFTWFKNGNVISGGNEASLFIELTENNQFPIFDLYTLVIDPENGSCLKTIDYNVSIFISPNYNSVELKTCLDFDTGYGTFDLEESKAELISGLEEVTEDDLNITYFTSESDALAGLNPVPNLENFENTSNLGSIYAKVASFSSCENLVEIKLFTFDFPDINLEDQILIYCSENFPEPINLIAVPDLNNELEYAFSWSTSETTPSIEINEAGTYSVEINYLELDCSITRTFEVIESNIAQFDHIVERRQNRSTLEIIIDPSSLGDYEFAINQPVNFQESNVFEGLSPGIYQVFVRDKLGCGLAEKTIGVLGIMEFFTPNGDGINDVWQISGLLENNSEEILLQVFDRYGKLLSSFTNNDRGWDGTYNGKNMPTDDYWYRVRLTDGTVETGNFTLKR